MGKLSTFKGDEMSFKIHTGIFLAAMAAWEGLHESLGSELRPSVR
jgi:hypothetical protein